jgi:hypothetical protein
LTSRKARAAAVAQERKFARVRLLNEELDRLTTDVDQRVASVANKGSFLAVAAGVLIAASVGQRWTVDPLGGVAALALACAGLLCATVALRPSRRAGFVAQRLADLYVDSQLSSSEVEVRLVRQKAKIIGLREVGLVARARWVSVGSVCLVVSAVALTIVFTAQLLGG